MPPVFPGLRLHLTLDLSHSRLILLLQLSALVVYQAAETVWNMLRQDQQNGFFSMSSMLNMKKSDCIDLVSKRVTPNHCQNQSGT
jgi:hypothetical protein